MKTLSPLPPKSSSSSQIAMVKTFVKEKYQDNSEIDYKAEENNKDFTKGNFTEGEFTKGGFTEACFTEGDFTEGDLTEGGFT